jgi:hypothetical protein
LAGSFLVSAGAFTVTLPFEAAAHEGKLDSLGCHYARNHRNYHCHEGIMEGRTFGSKGEAMRNWNRLKKDKKDDDDGF